MILFILQTLGLIVLGALLGTGMALLFGAAFIRREDSR